MGAGSVPANEDERLLSVARSGLLDSEPSPDFDEFTFLAAHVCATPIALITIVDERRQWFKSKLGLALTETPREQAFCAHTIRGGGLMEVCDAALDPRFAENPLVTAEPRIRFYAGVPIRAVDGAFLGTLCVIDRVPRSLEPAQRHALSALARHLEIIIRERMSTLQLRDANALLSRANERLAESEARFRQAFEGSAVGTALQALDGRYLQVNRALCELLGYSEAELLERTYLDVTHPADLERARHNLVEVPKSPGCLLTLEKRYVRKDGSEVWGALSTSCLVDTRGEPVQFITHVQDLTSRVAAEAARHESDERYRLLFERAEEAIYVAGGEGAAAGTIVMANRAAAALHGCEVEELIGKQLSDIVEGAASGVALAEIASVRDGVWFRGEERFHTRKDGSVFPAEVTTGPVVFSGRRCSIVFLRDVSDRRREIEALREAKERAEAANKMLESFSYTVAHDLRTPLRAIDGFAAAIEEDFGPGLGEAAREYLGRVRGAAARMAQLIDDILELSRLSRTELTRSSVDLSALARSTVDRLRQGDSTRVVDVVIEPDLTVLGDSRLLSIVLDNLLGNAWKFTSKVDHARIEVGAMPKTSPRVFFVCDNGAGFDMRHLDKLFLAFHRLHREREFEGTGIGLVTVARIVERHGGRVWAEGREGLGATFFFTVAADQERRSLPPTSARPV